MSDKEPEDPFDIDLSQLPDLDLDADDPASGEVDFPGLDDLEPLTEAAAESLHGGGNGPVEELAPELPDEAEVRPKAKAAPPVDDVPELPSEAEKLPELPLASELVPDPPPKATDDAARKPSAPAPKREEHPAPKPAHASPPPPKPSPPRPAPAPPVAAPKAGARPAEPASPPKAKAPEPVAKSAPATPVQPAKPMKPVKPVKPVAKVVKPSPVVVPKKAVAPKPEREPAPERPAPDAPAPAGLEPAKEKDEGAAAPTASLEPVALDSFGTDAAGAAAEGTTPAAGSSVPATAGAGSAGADAAPRELDKAPLHLRKAAWIVVVGSLLPWMGSMAGWIAMGLAKAIVVVGAWILYHTVRAGSGEKVPGFVAKLASIRFAKDSGKRKKSIVEQALLTVPTPAHGIGLGLMLFGIVCVQLDPTFGVEAWDDDLFRRWMKAMAEVGMLAWAAGTIVHIWSYAHGGKFNPIFPLMFIAMLVAGLFTAATSVRIDDTLFQVSGIVGGLVVGGGGAFACYTIFEAMKQAKEEGQQKKAAARAARDAARKAKRASAKG